MIDALLQLDLTGKIIYASVKWFLIIGAIASLVVGVILFIKPGIIQRFNERNNQQIARKKKLGVLEKIRDTDGFFYNNNKIIGWVMILSSIYCLYFFIGIFSENVIWYLYPPINISELLFVFALISMRWFLIIFIIVGLPIWFLLIFYPDKLRVISTFSNRWISLGTLVSPTDMKYLVVDDYVIKHNRVFGMVFILVSVLIWYTYFSYPV